MVSVPFVVAFSRFDLFSSTKQSSHIFGGPIQYNDGKATFSSCVDYCSRSGFSMGVGGRRYKAETILIFPISVEASVRYGDTIQNFLDLEDNHRLPLYYSIGHVCNTEFLVSYTHDLFGQPLNPEEVKVDDFGKEYSNSRGDVVTNLRDFKIFASTKPVPVTCLSAFNLVSALSGIDLGKITNWDVKSVFESCTVTKAVQDSLSSVRHMGRDQNFYVYERDDGLILSSCRDRSHVNGLPISEHIKGLSVYFDGVIKLFDTLERATPWDCEPLQPPEYLQTQLDWLAAQNPAYA